MNLSRLLGQTYLNPADIPIKTWVKELSSFKGSLFDDASLLMVHLLSLLNPKKGEMNSFIYKGEKISSTSRLLDLCEPFLKDMEEDLVEIYYSRLFSSDDSELLFCEHVDEQLVALQLSGYLLDRNLITLMSLIHDHKDELNKYRNILK